MSIIRYGIIGSGMITHSSADAIQKNDQSQVLAAWDPHKGRKNDLCEKYNIPTAADSAEAVLNNPDIDAIYIAVPNKFHASWAIQAIKAGKHVILDKPFALNIKQAKEVVKAANKSDKIFALGMNQRFVDSCQKIKTLADKGLFGEIYHGKAFWRRRSGIPKLQTWFGNKNLAGGGALLDIGVHLLDLCLYTIGNFEPESVSGVTYTKFGNRGLGEGNWGISDRNPKLKFTVDDFASALIKLKGGASVTLDVTWACHTGNPGMNVELFGTQAGATLYPAQVYRSSDIAEYDVVKDVKADIKYKHCCRFANFTKAILGEEEVCTTIEQSLAVQKILDGIYESCKTGKEVRIKK
ncbi:MAG: Gfo/Idh/MocA family oxidoreductase [Phycisphaeraceae bacterium]|nr:Gfo/Idh/MocA family oxidoreductase [Phycisphaeraceae bacterium]